MRYVAIFILCVLAMAMASAQAPAPATVTLPGQTPAPPWDAPHLSFDVASVKPNTGGAMMMSMRMLPNSFNVTNLPLRLIILQAYRVSGYQLVGGPSWLDSERFDINAKAPEGSRPDETPLMLRGLLAERFKLKIHGETRDSQIYALVLSRSDGKLGPKMSRTTDDCPKILEERRAAARAGGPASGPIMFNPPGPNEKPVCTISMRPTPMPGGRPLLTFKGGGQPIQMIVSQLSSGLNKLVVDRTGLTGLFDFELTMPMGTQVLNTQGPATSPAGGTTPTAPIDDGPNVFDAVSELGLKLESQRGPVDHIVIDSVERPTEN